MTLYGLVILYYNHENDLEVTIISSCWLGHLEGLLCTKTAHKLTFFSRNHNYS